MKKVLFLIPPFTQLNTPYPSTTYLKGFLNEKNIDSYQCDLGIEVISELFTKSGLQQIFQAAADNINGFTENSQRIFSLSEQYIDKIEIVIKFLRNQNPGAVYLLSDSNFYPQASKFEQIESSGKNFGTMGIRDRAVHFASLFLDDLSDFIAQALDPMFGFSRYAEHLAFSPPYFDRLEKQLKTTDSFIAKIMFQKLEKLISEQKPETVAVSIPFPGNLYAGLKCAKYLKNNRPEIKIIFGGGYINTELRSISDVRIFDYADFITLDDGEAPLLFILEYLAGKRKINQLKRTFVKFDNKVVFVNAVSEKDFSILQTGIPDYSDLPVEKYLSFVETANPMHRLWSDGFWNKLTLAHGCYWAKCSFCDTTLDYIRRYEPTRISLLCNKIEKIIEQTGNRGFHFVDEAAPPSLLRELASELIRRKTMISWWTNIRFEKNFTADLCRLLKESGCIAVTGGLEVASPRILKLINKGVTVEQVVKTSYNFSKSGIMVHAYLMYGFPTQTAWETIDSLEIVRQLFEIRSVHSAFWHRFSMTVHCAVGQNPEQFGVKRLSSEIFPFANNDVEFIDKTGTEHEKFGFGLKKALYNFMHEIGLDFDLSDWFDFNVPITTVSPDFIKNTIEKTENDEMKDNSRLLWLGNIPISREFTKMKKGKLLKSAELIFQNRNKEFKIVTDFAIGEFLMKIIPETSIHSEKKILYSDFRKVFEKMCESDFELFVSGRSFKILRENGLVVL
jgi:radical SAM superfamily enzyme YgiQ (UPF0313 family)